MSSCNSILQPGGPNASCCEKTMDGLLAFPKCLWMGREVTLHRSDDKWEVSYDMNGCTSCCCKTPDDAYEKNVKQNYRQKLLLKLRQVEKNQDSNNCSSTGNANAFAGMGCIVIGLVGAVAAIVFYTPPVLLSGIAMPFKAAILGCDDKAASYSKLAKIYLKHEKLTIKKSVLDTMLEEIKKEMEDKELVYWDLDKNKEEIKKNKEEEAIKLKMSIANLGGVDEVLKEFSEKTALLDEIQGNETSNLAQIKTTKQSYESLKKDQIVLQKELQRITAKITQNEVFLKCEQDYYFA